MTDSKSQTLQVNLKSLVLHYVGGNDDGSYNTVWSSHDGITWKAEAPLPAILQGFALQVLNDVVYLLGGWNNVTNTSTTFKSSDLSGGWTAGGNLPRASAMAGSAVANGKIYLAALNSTITTSDITNFTTIGNLPLAPSELGAAKMLFANGKFWIAGGQNWSSGAFQNNVWNSTDGVSWSSVGTLPEGRATGAFFYFNNAFYYAGGQTNGAVTKDSIFKSTDGLNWTTSGVLPAARDFISAVSYKNKIWIIGGCENLPAKTNVWSSSDATTWTNVGNLPSPRCNGEVIVY